MGPLDSYKQLLTLRQLMQQQQLGELNLQEARQAQQEQDAFRNLYAGGATPTSAQILGTLGPAGIGVVKGQMEIQKTQQDLIEKQLDVQGKRAGQLASLAGSIKSPDQYAPTIMKAVSQGLIEPQHGRDLIAHGFDAAQVQQFQDQALTAQQQAENLLAQAKAKREEQLFGPQLVEAQVKAAQGQRAEDANVLAAAIARGPEEFNTALAALPPGRQTPFQGATTALDVYQRALTPEQGIGSVGKTIPLPAAVQQQKVEQQAALGLAAEQAKQGFLNAKNEALVQSVMADRTGAVYAALPAAIQNEIAPALSQRGWTGFAAKPSDTELTKLQDLEKAVGITRNLKTQIAANTDLVGPISGRLTVLPYANERKKLQADIDLARQIIGKGLEGGVLRKEDEEKYKHILPTMADTPEVAQSKLDQLEQLLTRDVGTYRASLKGAGRQLPDSTVLPKAATQAAPPPTGGSVVEGKGGQKYIFTGGNPNDKRNYIPVIIQPPPGQ